MQEDPRTGKGGVVSELIKHLRKSFQDEEYRNAYAESFMNSHVAAQIKTLREENELTQEQLAEKIGTKQAGISRLENVNYSSWKVETLRKIARALNLRLKITFEEFGTLPGEIEGFRREGLLRAPFEKDPVFFPSHVATVVPIPSGSTSRPELVAKKPHVEIPITSPKKRRK
jgi:transcriptional regulator with XRE-family HTH domain